VDLTEVQWELMRPLIREPKRRAGQAGRPRQEPRAVLNGILWILRTGARWKDLPERYPSYQTCHRRFQQWERDGTLTRILFTLAADLRERGKLDLTEAFIDGTFASAKKGVLASVRPNEARGPRSWAWSTLAVFLSPPGSQVLRRMKSRSSKPRSRTVSSASSRGA
jgi:transposase